MSRSRYSGRAFMYGPKFNLETKKVLDQAITNSTTNSTANVPVS